MAKPKIISLDGLEHFLIKKKKYFVIKQDGKGLSTNDYTTTEKNKLAGLPGTVDSTPTNGSSNLISSGAVYTALQNAGGGAISKNLTLSSGSWSSTQYTITDADIHADSIVLFDAQAGSNQENYLALQRAKISCASISEGSLVLQSFGTVPTTNVNINLVIM